ncbi:MAG TPA: hypothetical protein VGY66_07140 [Gemmataceae bacterium]|nr:hypothetical protein [Gemmataceae bacterium]
MASVPIPKSPPPVPVETLEERFERLAAKWREETAYLSSSTAMFAHPAYQEIISLGQGVVPLLLRDLKKEPEHWTWALSVITGADPVPPADRGNLDRMAAAWLRWGQEHGYR